MSESRSGSRQRTTGPGLVAALLLALCGADALSAGSWAATSRSSSLQLGLLPFPLSEALLPGETKQVHLYEARFIQLFIDATASHDCVGQMLFTEAGNVVGVTSLLEVLEYRQEEVGVWARLRCVGRVELEALTETDYEYVSATATLLHDHPEDDSLAGVGAAPEAVSASALQEAAAKAAAREGQRAGAKDTLAGALQAAAQLSGVDPSDILATAGAMLGSLDAQLKSAHTSVTSMRTRLRRAAEAADEADSAVSSTGETDESGTRVEWGHELRDLSAESYADLDELIATRRSVLTAPLGTADGPRPAACSLLETLGEVWCVGSDDEAERQLLSYAAVATLPPNERVLALSMTSTTERIAHALCALRVQERRLAALLALRQADTPTNAGAEAED